MKPCAHGVLAGKFCARCPRVQAPVYVYDRQAVIALNPVRARQGLKPLTGRETYDKRTGQVLDEKGNPL